MNQGTKVNLLILCFIVFFTLTCYAQEPSAIRHEKFEPDYKGTCNTDVKVTSVEGDGLYVLGKISIRDGNHTLWCYGAKHIWIGKLSYAGYIFDSDKKYPLQFTVSKDKGYLFLKGKGTVTTPKGKIVKLKSAGIGREEPYGIDIANINPAPKGEIPVKVLAGAELGIGPTENFIIKSGEVETEQYPIYVGRLKKEGENKKVQSASAQNFSADMVHFSLVDTPLAGKIYVTEEKTRVETHVIITITRVDKNLVWMLIPHVKVYVEQPLGPDHLIVSVGKMPGEIERKHLGTEIVAGKQTEKYRISYTVGNKRVTIFQWVDTDSGFPIKIAAEDKDGGWIMKNHLKTGKQPNTLFEIPAGYQKGSFE